jgi:hypothetical protein
MVEALSPSRNSHEESKRLTFWGQRRFSFSLVSELRLRGAGVVAITPALWRGVFTVEGIVHGYPTPGQLSAVGQRILYE